MNTESIKQAPPALSARAAKRTRLPNFCNMGIMLRLLVIVNLLCIAAAVGYAGSFRDIWPRFLGISIFAQPAIIASLLASCGLRPLFVRLPYWQGIGAIFLLELLIATMLWWILRAMPFFTPTIAWWQYAFFFAFITLTILLYFDLHARALSPALTEARLQALQARIQPHFLFNSLNAALSLIRSEPRRAEQVLENMAELFRVLMADNRNLAPLADEIQLCRHYLDIEQIRLGERLQVNWQIDAMPQDALVPPLILQPLIENAVYHGIEPQQGKGELTIHIAPRGRELVIRLSNPYQPGSSYLNGNRMAISNIKERLQLHFDAEASLKAEAAGNQYIVTITLPNVDKEP